MSSRTPTRIDAHDRFPHHTIDSLGYDWSRAGNPAIEPRHPSMVYLPEDESEVVAAVKHAGPAFRIRGMGHSDNDLVLADRHVPVICTQRLNELGEVSRADRELWIRVGAGTRIDDLEDHLANQEPPLGLPVRPDHGEISVGGLASVGGVSTSCHLHGLFVDNVREVEYVDRAGNLRRVERGSGLETVLAGTDEFGVIVSLVCRVLPVDKRNVLLECKTESFDATQGTEYAEAFRTLVETMPPKNPPQHVRGVWQQADKIGMPSTANASKDSSGYLVQHVMPKQDPGVAGWKKRGEMRQNLDRIGELAGRLRPPLDRFEPALKKIGIEALIDALTKSKYFTHEDVETFTDRVIDTSVGSPGHMLAMFVPLEHFERTFTDLAKECAELKQIPTLTIYSRPINSLYLSGPEARSRVVYADLSVFAFLSPNPGTWSEGTQSVQRIRTFMDETCERANKERQGPRMFRYLATRTKFRPDSRDDRNPNCQWR